MSMKSFFKRSSTGSTASTTSAASNLTTFEEERLFVPIAELIDQCQWVKLRESLEAAGEGGQSDVVSANPTLIHRAIQNGAPKSILMLLAQNFPEALSKTDDNQRYPIHAACAHGASPSFVFHCIEVCPTSVGAQDKDGMTPVQILCQKYKSSYIEKFPHKVAEKDMEQILWMIYRRAPATIVFEDKNFKSAIEYALESEVNMEFFKTLQHLIIHFNQNNARKISARMKQQRKEAQNHGNKKGGSGGGSSKRPPAAFAA